MINALNWFEIPATDFDRARKFYETIMGEPITEMSMPDHRYGMFPSDMEKGVGGGLVQGAGYKPSADGSLVYLNGGDDLTGPLSRIEKAGGKIVMPKTSIGPNGFIAQFIDTEGNKVALHSPK